MNASSILGNFLNIAKTVLPLVPFGAEGLAAGEAVLKTFDDFREVSGAAPEKIAEFDATREAFEAAVNAHTRRTADSLGDG